LVDDVIKSDSMTHLAAIGELIADDDGAYDNNDIFRYLGDNQGILSCIKVRKNARIN
jgi:hypothetical protein